MTFDPLTLRAEILAIFVEAQRFPVERGARGLGISSSAFTIHTPSRDGKRAQWAHNAAARASMGLVEKKCPCGASFFVHPYSGGMPKRYCSRACMARTRDAQFQARAQASPLRSAWAEKCREWFKSRTNTTYTIGRDDE